MAFQDVCLRLNATAQCPPELPRAETSVVLGIHARHLPKRWCSLGQNGCDRVPNLCGRAIGINLGNDAKRGITPGSATFVSMSRRKHKRKPLGRNGGLHLVKRTESQQNGRDARACTRALSGLGHKGVGRGRQASICTGRADGRQVGNISTPSAHARCMSGSPVSSSSMVSVEGVAPDQKRYVANVLMKNG
eukprot:scaffold131185_cov27-Tisochrysis_lutea.AAC.2